MSQIATVKKQTIAPKAATGAPMTAQSTASIGAMVNALVDGEGYRKRFDDLLGKRAPQFVSSIVSMINGDTNLQKAFRDAPITIIQSALRAASYDLPIDPGLGYAYIVPFSNSKKLPNGQWEKRMEAQFIMGYKGMIQLALRTGAYDRINVSDVREGELISYDRLREDAEFEWIDDETERNKRPIIGWVGYFRLRNGMEKTIYMSKSAVEAHERKNRKGEYMGKGWKDNFDAMAAKTVLRRLIGKWGLMSIDYQKADDRTLETATALAKGKLDDLDDMEIEPDAVDDVVSEAPTKSDKPEDAPLPFEDIPPVQDDDMPDFLK